MPILQIFVKQSKLCLVLGLSFFFFIRLHAQTISKQQLQSEYERFKNNTTKEFQNYKDERDKEFADLLKKSWSNFKLEDSKQPKAVPTPPKQPAVLPPAPKQEDPTKIPSIKLPVLKIPEDQPIVDIKPNIQPTFLPLNKSILFYNLQLNVNFDNKMLAHCNQINEKGVSDYWNMVSGSNYPNFLEEINLFGTQMQLNDWGYYELVNNVAQNLLADKNDQTLFCFFMLSHLKYDVKVAKRNNAFILMLPFETTIYKKSYININDRKYYIIGNESEGLIYTFKQSFSDSNKPLNLSFSKNLRLGNNYTSKNIYFKKFDKTIPVQLNTNLIQFYNEVPMSDLSIFFSSKFDPKTERSLTMAIAPLLENKNELEAVNIILDFVQKSFEYKTDMDQFGYEKFYFPEDIFFYPFSDCEDRAVLFAHLIKSLLRLEVIGLEYNTHAACAVKFNGPINGDAILYKDQKFIICDPTYIGASAGMAMPQFVNETPKIVKTTYN